MRLVDTSDHMQDESVSRFCLMKKVWRPMDVNSNGYASSLIRGPLKLEALAFLLCSWRSILLLLTLIETLCHNTVHRLMKSPTINGALPMRRVGTSWTAAPANARLKLTLDLMERRVL
jgi:hypothetical protein